MWNKMWLFKGQSQSGGHGPGGGKKDDKVRLAKRFFAHANLLEYFCKSTCMKYSRFMSCCPCIYCYVPHPSPINYIWFPTILLAPFKLALEQLFIQDKKKKYEPPIPTRVGKKKKKTKGPDAASKLPLGKYIRWA